MGTGPTWASTYISLLFKIEHGYIIIMNNVKQFQPNKKYKGFYSNYKVVKRTPKFVQLFNGQRVKIKEDNINGNKVEVIMFNRYVNYSGLVVKELEYITALGEMED